MFPALLRAPRSLPRSLPRPSLPSLGTGVLLVVLAVPSVLSLAQAWGRNPDYEYAWFLAPVVLWLFVRARPWRQADEPRPLAGLLTLALGGLIHLAAQVITWPLFDYAAWLLLGRGVLLALWGPSAVKRAMPILLFGFLLFPLPLAWLNEVALWMQAVISKMAAALLSLFWVCHQEGNIIHLAGLDTPLSVAIECSGVRQLLIFVALASLLSLFLHSRWRRLVMIAAALPIAVLANLLRVLALAILARVAGPSAIQGVFHDAPLLLTLPLGGLGLWWLYGRLQQVHDVTVLESSPTTPHHAAVGLVLSVLVILQIALQVHLHAVPRTASDAAINLNALPNQLGTWSGHPHPEAAGIAKQAAFADETLTRIYSDDRGNAVALYVVSSRTGRDREHHPEICLRDAGGARELPQGRRQIPLDHGVAQRFAYQRDRLQRTTVYYWHYTLLPPREGLSAVQSLYLRQNERLPSVSVQVQVNVTDPHVWQSIETTLLPELHRRLLEMLPSQVKVGSDRLPIRFIVE